MANPINVGDVRQSKNYGQFIVLEKLPGKKSKVRFITTGYEAILYNCQIRTNEVKDLLLPSVYSVGYYGTGYTEQFDKTTVQSIWQVWRDMIKRCYDQKTQEYRPSYTGCSVDPRWHNFQNFAKFYIEHPHREVGWQLDKDLLLKGNKLYSPETCVFLPRELNGIIIRNSSIRGLHPIGVSYSKSNSKFRAACQDGCGGNEFLGYFTTPLEAFLCYKLFKEATIKSQAMKWKNLISPAAFKALMEYEVSIED